MPDEKGRPIIFVDRLTDDYELTPANIEYYQLLEQVLEHKKWVLEHWKDMDEDLRHIFVIDLMEEQRLLNEEAEKLREIADARL